MLLNKIQKLSRLSKHGNDVQVVLVRSLTRNISSTTGFLSRTRAESKVNVDATNAVFHVHHVKSSHMSGVGGELSSTLFEQICEETLESLNDFFEDLIESTPDLKSADLMYSDGVLTVSLGAVHGTYVINRQTPNKQIWLSSPVSGPKRYDLQVASTADSGVHGVWIYKHSGESLHRLLKNELSQICKKDVDLTSCLHVQL